MLLIDEEVKVVNSGVCNCMAIEMIDLDLYLLNNNNNGYFYVLFLHRAHSPYIKKKQCEHRIRKNQQIKSTARDARSHLK